MIKTLTVVCIASIVIFTILRLLITDPALQLKANENIAIAVIGLVLVRLFKHLSILDTKLNG